ncbi:MAG TPA: RDD family protein [Bryobacteraceae bacterium]|nr:RDD family protein [Bryobacteraceae bacterium]
MSPTSYEPGALFCAECGRPCTPDELARFGDLLICPACKNNYAQKLREGVAPAAAVRYGGFWIRFLAAIIDGIILLVVGSIVQYAVLGSTTRISRAQPGADPMAYFGAMMGLMGVLWVLNTAIGCTYETFFVAKMSATPGKMALGLKVVRADGSRVSAGRAAGRYFAKILSAMILLIGYIMAGLDGQKRALHDMICDTRVIQTRS